MAMSNRTRETVQLIGAIAGIVAFIGTVVLWITTKASLVSMAGQTVGEIKKAAPASTPAITVEFNPLSGLWSVFWSWPTLVVALLLAVTILGIKLYRLTHTTR